MDPDATALEKFFWKCDRFSKNSDKAGGGTINADEILVIIRDHLDLLVTESGRLNDAKALDKILALLFSVEDSAFRQDQLQEVLRIYFSYKILAMGANFDEFWEF